MNNRRAISTTSLLLLVVSGPVLAADGPFQRAAPDARKRFEEVCAAYRGLASYQDHGVFTRSITVAGKPRSEQVPLSLKFVRPNRILLDAGEVQLVGDGKNLTTVLAPTRRYLVSPSPSTLNLTTIADGPAGAILLGGASGPPAQLLLKLVLGVDPDLALPDRATALQIDEDRKWEDRTYLCLRIDQGDEPPFRVLIDPETKLVRRMEYILDAKTLAGRVPSGGEISEMTLAWTSGPISTVAGESFAFKTPPGFVRIKAAEAKPVVAEAAQEKNELVGKPAPEFTLTILEGADKTKKVALADLAGKVVVLDFWATWCPPCLRELPEIQKLADDFAKGNKSEVVIVAVSQDRDPEDGSPVRKLVEDLLDSKKLNLAAGPVARVALDPEQAVGDAFQVQALPTVVILDAKGVVRSVHVGFSDDIRDVLSKEIAGVLSGKVAETPKAGNVEIPRAK